MKTRCLGLALAALAAAVSFAQQADTLQEQVSVVIGDSQELLVPFVVQEIRCESPNVKVRRSGNKSCVVSGVAAGQAVVELQGVDTLKTFTVTVVDTLQPIIKAIGRDLEEVPEVDISVNNGKICLRGEISKSDHWDLYHLVLSRYQQYCFDYVVFVPGSELLASFGKVIEQSGYRIVPEATSENPGCIEMKYAGGTLTLTGYFFNKLDVEEVKKIVERQSWLAESGKGARAGSVPCIANLYVVDRLIDVGVVFVSLSKNALEQFGNSGAADGSLGHFSIVADMLKTFAGGDKKPKESGWKFGFGFTRTDASVEGVLQILARNSLTTGRKAGHVTFNSNGETAQAAEFKEGGQMLLKVSGINGGNVEKVDFGFKVGVKGILTHADEVKLDLDLEDSEAPVIQAGSGDYVQAKITARMPVVACLGETIVIGGAHSLSVVKSDPSGWAFFRWIPVISWFTSSAIDQADDTYTLILVSPEYADEAEPLRRRPSEETAKTERVVQKTAPKEAQRLTKPAPAWYQSFFFWNWFSGNDED